MTSSLNAKYGLKRVVNASGRMSILGVSSPTDTVMDAMKHGGKNYVEIADLVDKAGDYIADVLGSEAAVVVNSASSGIALSIAALVTEGNRRKSERLHQENIPKSEVIMLKGHNVQYGAPVETMVHLGGGQLVERSEERRVGKECGSRGRQQHWKKWEERMNRTKGDEEIKARAE